MSSKITNNEETKRIGKALWIMLDGCSKELGISEVQLVSILRINHKDFQAWAKNKDILCDRENPPERVLAFLDIYNCLTSLFVNQDAPAEWLLEVKPDNQSKLYEGRSPLEVMVQDNEGIFKTVEYLRMIMGN